MYTYQTKLYPKLNEAGQTKDITKLNTLGPYACVLRLTLMSPPKKCYENWKHKLEPFQWIEGDDNATTKVRVFRGLGLNKGAVKYYRDRLEDQQVIRFQAFTSTSFDIGIANEFA